MNGASLVLSLNYRTRLRWRTVVPMTDRHWVRSNTPNTPLSNFMQVSSNEHMRQTVIPTTVRPAQLFWLSETLFLKVSLHYSKCPPTDTCDRPSYLQWSVLHIPSYLSETLLQGSPYIHSLRNKRWIPWRSVIVTTSCYQARRVLPLL